MNAVWTRVLRSVYRKEPISGFLIMVGISETTIGTLDAVWPLAIFGLGTVGTATLLRWWLLQRRAPQLPERSPVYALPPADRPLPMLSMSKHRPPQ
jgi:hypothetical protein